MTSEQKEKLKHLINSYAEAHGVACSEFAEPNDEEDCNEKEKAMNDFIDSL